MAEIIPIKEAQEPTYRASDIVTQVQLAVDVGMGKMSLVSHVLNAEGLPALKAELDKLTAAADWVSAKYGLRNLKLQLDQEEKALLRFRIDKESYEARCRTEWTEIQKRRGDYRPSESQRAIIQNHENSIASRIQVIEKIKKDIAITEAILEGTQ